MLSFLSLLRNIHACQFLRTALDMRFDLWVWIKSDFLPAAVVGPIEDPEATQIYQDRRRLFDDVYTALVPLFPRLHA